MRQRARQLDDAMAVLASFDEGVDLVLYYKHLMVIAGDENYLHHFARLIAYLRHNEIHRGTVSLLKVGLMRGLRLRTLMRVIDSHTEGEPTRTIFDADLALGSGTLAEKAKIFEQNYRFLWLTAQEQRK